MKGASLKPKIDFKKQPYAEPKFMLPPDSSKLPVPFEDLIKPKQDKIVEEAKWMNIMIQSHFIYVSLLFVCHKFQKKREENIVWGFYVLLCLFFSQK